MLNKEEIVNKILEQQSPFTVVDMAAKTEASVSSVYVILQHLMSGGKVILDHKIGKRIYYGVTTSGLKARTDASAAGSASILQFPPSERMNYVRDLTEMVIDGYSPSLLITGMAGIGKTYLVRQTFAAHDKVEGVDYQYVQGHSSPLGLYALLHNNRNATIVFDDCDSVFRDDISLNLLKCALDSYATRCVSWNSSRIDASLESSFVFKGQIIFVSNVDAGRIDDAVKSRTIVIDLQMTRKEICDYVRGIVEKVEPRITLGTKMEVVEFLEENRDQFERFNIRTFIKAIRVRAMATRTGNPKWRELIRAIN